MNNKMETYYLDDDGNFVDPDKATRGIIRETDEKGNLVRETFGRFVPIEEDEKVNEK